MITIPEIIFVMFLFSKQYIAASLWVMSIILFQMSYERGNEHIYLEVIKDYPIVDCVKPKIFKFWYKKLNNLSYKHIPKEMYYCETFKMYGFIIYSVLTTFFYFIDEYVASLIGGIYIGLYCMSSLLSAVILKKKSFIERYKCINRHNIKYIFLPENEHSPRKIGACRIASDSKRRGKTFVNVIVLDTGEVKYNVLFRENKVVQAKLYYTLYEICNVFYIE